MVAPQKDKIVAVFTNMSNKNVRLSETHEGWSNEATSITTYTTTSNKNLTETTISGGESVILEAESVTTVVYNLK